MYLIYTMYIQKSFLRPASSGWVQPGPSRGGKVSTLKSFGVFLDGIPECFGNVLEIVQTCKQEVQTVFRVGPDWF